MENELSFGQQLVDINFNPSGNEKVDKAKRLCSEIANMIEECRVDAIANGTYTSLRQMFVENSFSEILNAQMNVVKVLTLK
jgi:ATP sulfurylase